MRVDNELSIEGLENATISAGSFSHEDHVYLAWLYLDAYPVTDAIARFTSALKRLTIKLGVPQKYHETITWFFLLAIAERRANAPESDWPTFRQANADLLTWPNEPLNRYYSQRLLQSDAARQQFLLPDKLAA